MPWKKQEEDSDSEAGISALMTKPIGKVCCANLAVVSSPAASSLQQEQPDEDPPHDPSKWQTPVVGHVEKSVTCLSGLKGHLLCDGELPKFSHPCELMLARGWTCHSVALSVQMRCPFEDDHKASMRKVLLAMRRDTKVRIAPRT